MSKILNLLYDEWDYERDVPYLNGYKFIDENKLENLYNFFNDHIIGRFQSDMKFTIKNYNIDEINESENFFWILGYKNYYFSQIIEKKLPLSEVLKEKIRLNKNIKIIFLTLHDAEEENGFLKLIELIKNENLPEEQFYFINNNSNLILFQKKFVTKINTHKLSLLPISAVGCLINIGGCRYNINKDGKFFMCFNNKHKEHRVSAILMLKKYELLDETNWSYIGDKGDKDIMTMISTVIDQSYIKNLKDEIDFFDTVNMKFSDYEQGQYNNIFDFHTKYSNTKNNILGIPEFVENYEQSYVNIVTESHFFSEHNILQITEKSFKPFYYYQFPIFITSPNHIKTLKEKYDFDFFDDIINHSYDEIFDNKKRFDFIIKELLRINSIKETFKKFYIDNKIRFDNNKIKVEKIINNNDDYLFFEKLI